MMNVKVISKEIIKPSTPTQKHPPYHNLSLLDHLNGSILMPLIFFYSFDPSVNVSINTMLSRLKESLATTLSIFYPLAGRYKDDSNHVVCSDEGVPYTEGRVDCHLSDVVNKVEVSELDKLLPCKSHGPSELLLVIQVNVFECGGVAIGVCFNHKVSDGFSVLTFLNTWSLINREGTSNNKSYNVPCFDLAELFPLTSRLLKPEMGNEEAVLKRFTFDAISIRALKTKYYNGKRNVSSGSILLAFIYSRIVSILELEKVQHDVTQSVNLRSKISTSPPLKAGYYFGNAYINAIVKPSTVDNKSNVCLGMVEHMREAIARINTNFLEKTRHGTRDMSFVTDQYEQVKAGEVVTIGFTNYSGLPIYESDFGWGKPVWVTFAPAPLKNLIVLIPSLSGSHVDVYAYLSQENMKKLECDQEFTSFTKIINICSKL